MEIKVGDNISIGGLVTVVDDIVNIGETMIATKYGDFHPDVVEKIYDAYKVVSRNLETKRQYKKRVYIGIEDFNRYSPDLIERYSRYHSVEVYGREGKEWVLIKNIESKNWNRL